MDLQRVYWRLVGPTGRVLLCGLYETLAGLEVRCGYGELDTIRSALVRTAEWGALHAVEWKKAALGLGFTDSCGKCRGGWVCEDHPDQPMGHQYCDGAGMPCDCGLREAPR